MRAESVVVVDIPVCPPLEHLLERHPGLQPGQRRTQTEMQALAEAQVAARAVDVEAVGIGELRLVPIG